MKRLIFNLVVGCLLLTCYSVGWAEQGEEQVPSVAFLQQDAGQLYRDASAAYESKHYAKAIDQYLKFIQLVPQDVDVLYNLACCYALLGDEKSAGDLLLHAAKLGWEEVQAIDNDPDFDAVRNKEYFKAKVSEVKAKVESVVRDLGETRFIKSTAYLPYRVWLPNNYDKSKHYRMIIGLHGFGDKAHNFVRLWKKVESPDFIFVVPQAPISLWMNGQIGYSWELWDEKIGKDTTDAAVEYITQVTKLVQSEFKPSEIYLLGFSQGCGMTLITGIKHPELYDGLIAFGGWLAEDYISADEIKAANKLRVFVGHGVKDNVVEYKSGYNVYTTLKENGYEVFLFSFDGAHRIPINALNAVKYWLDK